MRAIIVPTMALTSGARLGPYEVLAPLDAGGMGEVYRARDTRLDRVVAIKILPRQFSADAVYKQRFEREAKLLDFGLAKPVATLANLATMTDTMQESPVTEQGTIVGTFQYMSPEQLEGKEV